MRCLALLLVVCAAVAAQSVQADDLAAIRAACADDAQKLCAGVQPGGGRIVACLKEHKDSLSDQCKQAAGVPVNPGSSSAPGPAAAAGAPGASVAAAASQAKPAPARKAAPVKAASAAAGEKFAERVIADADHGGMRAATFHLPEKWHYESKIEWHYLPLEAETHRQAVDELETGAGGPRANGHAAAPSGAA